MTLRERPIISVIVPVWNGRDDIGTLLDALARQDAPAESFETIVVDNGSTDDTAAVVKAAGNAALLHEPEPGSYRARNRGLAAARGEWLLFTDADCVPATGWVSRALQTAHDAPDAGIIGGAIHLFGDGTAPALELFERLTSLNQKAYVAGGACITANWLCRKSTLMDVGGFDAGLLSGGDLECSKRIAATGLAIRYDEGMVVRHPIRASMTGLVRKRRRVVGGVWAMRGGGWKALIAANYRFAKWWLALMLRVVCADASLPVRMAATVIACRLYAVTVAETLRLFAGAKPYRS